VTPYLQTDRLSLRPLTIDDAADLHRIFSDPRAMRFMPTPPHTDPDQTRRAIALDLMIPGAVYWAVRLHGSDTVIGQVNYLGQTRIAGLGYILHPDYWGQGLTAEACRPALDYGFTTLGHDRVELWIDENNAASLRVAQKLGFRPRGWLALKYSHERDHHFMLVWGMLAQEWLPDAPATPPATAFFTVEPVLMVRDIRAATEFYRDRLGFHLDFLYGEPPYHAGVSRGEWSGSLVSIQLSQAKPDHEINPAAYLHIRVSSAIDALHAQYHNAGVEIIAAPEDKPWGFREFAIKDLDGHVLVFATIV